jgi:HEAT repeat protein
MRHPVRGSRAALLFGALALFGAATLANQDEKKVKGKTVDEWIDVLKKSKDSKESVEAVSALCSFGPKAKAAIPVLTEIVKDNKAFVAEEAAGALFGIGDDALPALKELLKAEKPGARAKAVRALMSLVQKKPAAKEVAPLLIDLFKNDPDATVRAGAASGLGHLGIEAKTAVPLLVAGLKDNNDDIFEACARALGRFGKEAKSAVPDMVAVAKNKDRDEYVRASCVRNLAEIGPDAKESVKDLIVLAQKDSSEEVRGTAAYALRKIDPEAAKKAGVKPPMGKKKE